MLDKYFGFVKIDSENSVIDSLIEHTRIDEEELFLLKKMVAGLIEKSPSLIEDSHLKIAKIRSESNQAFEHTEEQIIQATNSENFFLMPAFQLHNRFCFSLIMYFCFVLFFSFCLLLFLSIRLIFVQ